MKVEVLADEEAVARRGASLVAEHARVACALRERFLLAMSGGRTPWLMLRHLCDEDVPWDRVQIFQVDERAAPAGDPERNLTHLLDVVLVRSPLRPEQIHAMPVEDADLAAAAQRYAQHLRQLAGSPPVLDLVHLGLGADGHTASLVPNDPALNIQDADVAATGIYQGRRRLTLTYPFLNRARHIMWLATGSAKAEMVARLLAQDPSIPAGHVYSEHAILLVDRAAAARSEPEA